MNQQWPRLDEFITLCFNEDIDLDFPADTFRESARQSVESFLKTENREQIERIRVELKDFLHSIQSEEELGEALFTMYCRFEFRPWRPWLESVLNQIDTFLGYDSQTAVAGGQTNDKDSRSKTTNKNFNGTTDNTSGDALRRQRFKNRSRRILIRLLIIAALWEIGYRCSRMVHGEANVSRFGGIMSMFRQLFGGGVSSSNSNISQHAPPPNTTPKTSERKHNQATTKTKYLSTVELGSRNNSLGTDEFMFIVTLYKQDSWVDTKIPVAAGNLINCYTIGEEPQAHIVAKIANTTRELRLTQNMGNYPNLNLAIFDYEVEADHIVLKEDQMVTLALKLVDNENTDKVTLRVTLDILHGKGGQEKTKQRELALIGHVKQYAASH